MEKIQFQVSTSQLHDIKHFCQLNDIEIEELLKKCFKTGYNIEKYGLLGKMGGEQEKQVEIPVEVIKYVEIIKEVPVEKIVTIYDNSNEGEHLNKIQNLESERKILSTKIEELESEVLKFSTITKEKENIFQNDDKSKQLQQTIQTLIGRIREKDNEINNLKEEIKNCNKNIDVKPAVFLRNSNLGDDIYKE